MTSFLDRRWYRFLQESRARAYVAHCRTLTERHPGWKVLEPAPTQRQFRTAHVILDRLQRQRGVLLADDVGLGKTTVAALCAVACARAGKSVRILAPNESMARRWRQELELHIYTLAGDGSAETVPFLRSHELDRARRRLGQQIRKLAAGMIAVSTHGKGRRLKCDLLIIDEAHRTRSEMSGLGKRLATQGRDVDRLLVLTATPFSIDPNDLCRVLRRVGATPDVIRDVTAHTAILRDLWCGRLLGDVGLEAEKLATAAEAAVEAIRPFVIRHAVDDLSLEKASFGCVAKPSQRPVEADGGLLEAMLRLDRAMGLALRAKLSDQVRRNDPRYHVGVQQMQEDARHLLDRVRTDKPACDAAVQRLVEVQLRAVRRQLDAVKVHPKVRDTVAETSRIVGLGEKVLIFCDHHRTATELALALRSELAWPSTDNLPAVDVWRGAWNGIFSTEWEQIEQGESSAQARQWLEAFVDWLCSDGIRAQVSDWLGKPGRSASELRRRLEAHDARGHSACQPIAKHARSLYAQLTDRESPSTRAVLRRAARGEAALPGAQSARVIAVCNPQGLAAARTATNLFAHGEPDITLAIFNSPFGPDVLVTTDRLSEGVDLHRFCRHLIHHELDPSPVRTVQRNGRLRRVNSWAARTGQPLCIAYPKLLGTRDEKLVEIMMSRLGQFDLLLGGVRDDVDPDEVADATSRAQQILDKARSRLSELKLAVR